MASNPATVEPEVHDQNHADREGPLIGHNGNAVPKTYHAYASQGLNPTLGRVGNPGPLGLLSFALTTFVFGLYQCGAGLPGSNPYGGVGPDQAVFGLAVFVGGLAQLIAGIMEFTVGNTFGTTLHISYSGFYLSFAMSLVPSLGLQQAYLGNKRALSYQLGIFLILWCFITLIFLLAALRTSIVMLAVLGVWALAFFFLAISRFTSTHNGVAAVRLNRTGGAFAVISAFIAFYAGASSLMAMSTTPIRFPIGEFRQRTVNARTAVV